MTIPTPQEIAERFAQGVAERARWDLDYSEQIFRALCGFDFARPRALTELAITLAAQGRGAAALETVSEAALIAPFDPTIQQNALVLEKLREPEDPSGFVAKHRQWGERFAPPGGGLHTAMLRDLHPDRRLHLAYLGVDAHSALRRFMPVLARHHDGRQFDIVFVYRSSDDARIEHARRVLPQVQHLNAAAMSARDLALLLARLQLDIAIDLCGHGVGQVLNALAYRPAPLQLTWLDYVATTGVSAIDARIADAITDPLDANWPQTSTEEVLRLPVAQWCAEVAYRDIGAVDSKSAAPIILGLVNAANKISPELLRRAELILQRIPQARLRILGISGEAAQQQIRASFPNQLQVRIELVDRVSEEIFLSLLHGITVALDPLVFSGATSTLDCLAAGIPVVTQGGVLPHTRSTASILQSLHLSEWIAGNADEYIDIVVNLASDQVALREWRRRLPERLRASSLTDGAQFVPALETLLRTSWKGLCAQHQTSPPTTGEEHQRTLVAQANAHLQHGDPQTCVYALETLYLAVPGESIRRNLSRAWNNLGRNQRLQGSEAQAREAFALALEIWPENPEAQVNQGATPQPL